MLSNSSSQRSSANQVILNGVAKEKGFMQSLHGEHCEMHENPNILQTILKFRLQTADSYRLLF